jgi:hypothetical protein
MSLRFFFSPRKDGDEKILKISQSHLVSLLISTVELRDYAEEVTATAHFIL